MRWMNALAALMLVASTASAASVDGLKVHSTSAGSGRTTLVLVHGWTCDSSSWAAPMPALAVWGGTNQQMPNVDETRKSLPPARRLRRQAGAVDQIAVSRV